MKRLLVSPAFRFAFKKPGDSKPYNNSKAQPKKYEGSTSGNTSGNKSAVGNSGMFNRQSNSSNQMFQQRTPLNSPPSKINQQLVLKLTDNANKNWFEMNRTIEQENKQNSFLNQTIDLIKQQKFGELNQFVKKVISSQNFTIKTEVFSQVCEHLLYEEIQGQFNSQSAIKFNTVFQLCDFLDSKSKDYLETYSQWITPILRKLVKQYQNSIPAAVACFNQFEQLITKLMTNHSKLFKGSQFISQQFFDFVQIAFYGKQTKLERFVDLVSKYHSVPDIKFVEAFRKSLMLFRSQTEKNVFQVSDTLLRKYKQSFSEQNSNIVIVCLMLASHTGYMDMFVHFKQYYSQIFVKFPNDLYKKIHNYAIIDNNTAVRSQELQLLLKTGANTMGKMQALIRNNRLKEAYDIFQKEHLKNQAIKRWRNNVLYIILRYQRDYLFDDEPLAQNIQKEGTKFVENLNEQILWKMFLRSQDFKLVYKKQLTKDTDSYWKELFEQKRADQIYEWSASGFLDEVKQVRKVPEGMFSLQTYLKHIYPQQKQKLEERYQVQKELIKYAIKVQALMEDQKTQTNYAVNDDLKQIQSNLSEQALQVLQNCQLKDYDIASQQWKTFAKRFKDFKRYHFITKKQGIITTPRKIMKNIESIQDPDTNKYLTSSFLEDIWVKARELFSEAQQFVRTAPNKHVQQLILWGLYCREPMAIYMGQKLAMLTGQKIPHYLAKRVSDMLSYRRDIDPQLIIRCKQALKYIGKIDRQKIYDDNKDYHHILNDKGKQRLAMHIYTMQTNEPRLLEIDNLPPNVKDLQQQPVYYFKRASQRFNST